MKDKSPFQRGSQLQPDGGKNVSWISIFWFLLIGYLFISIIRGFGAPDDSLQLSYTDFKIAVKDGKVARITMQGSEIKGEYKDSIAADEAGGQDAAGGGKAPAGHGLERPVANRRHTQAGDSGAQPLQFRTVKPELEDPDLLPLLEAENVMIAARRVEQSWWAVMMISLLPWILILGLLFYASRRMQRFGGQGALFGFGKSKAKRFNQQNMAVKYDDVAGLDNAKKELREIVAYMKDPRQFMGLGATLPKGILLVGPPGVGKTLMAQATAGEAEVPFFSISGSEFIEMFVGVGASRVRDMFNEAKQVQPAIIFIDELDSIGRVRGTGVGGGHDEREQTLNQILSEMDGFSPREAVILLAATNRPDVLDPALVRPGRFDRQITLDLPQKKARQKILETHTRRVPLALDVNLKQMADRTVGMSGAELRNIVNEAALLAARDKKNVVESSDFEKARDKVLMGIEREDIISDEEKRVVAFHEAGHALMAKLQQNTDPLQKVSIIPRGRALGATEQIPLEDRHNLQKGYLLGRIGVMLGGRVAETLNFGEVSTGASDDLKRATQIARRMVCEWGMSESLGPVSFPRSEVHPFLGRELASESKDFSEHTARQIDEEIRAILKRKEKDAIDLLKANIAKLEILAEALLEHETLTSDQVDRLLEKN